MSFLQLAVDTAQFVAIVAAIWAAVHAHKRIDQIDRRRE